MKRVALAIVVILIACTSTKNPAKCVDGVCIDPAQPYCDFDGLIGGTPNACIAADCTPGQLEACRGDTAVKCDQAGNDYVDIECPLGCDPSANGCRECTTNVQCPTQNPICDSTSSLCRACATDDECDSRVCDLTLGQCHPESDIVYAAPNGSTICSKNQPCDLVTGVMAASISQKTLRMLPGMYVTGLDVRVPTLKPIPIVATGATISVIGSSYAISVTDGATIALRNLTSISERHLRCTSATSPLSGVSIDRSTFTTVGSSPMIEIGRCTTKISRSSLTGSGGNTGLYTDGALELDQVFMQTGNITTLNATRTKLQITNSLLVHTTPEQFASENTSFLFAYSTFMVPASWDVCKFNGVSSTIKFENSIVASTGVTPNVMELLSPDCSFVNTIVYPHLQTPPPGVIVEDPQFVDSAMNDFHLKATSPALDRATTGTVPSSVDLEGRFRGTMPDLGAYERP